MNCDKKLYIAEFPELTLNETGISIGLATYDSSKSILDIVNNGANSYLYIEPGINGLYTLKIMVVDPTQEVSLSYTSGGGGTVTAQLIGGRPVRIPPHFN